MRTMAAAAAPAARIAIPSKAPSRGMARVGTLAMLTFLLAHAPMALAMEANRSIATMHAMLTIGVGMLAALTDRSSVRTAFIAAYIAGSEVLWRMTEAKIFWESGKYATAALFLIAIVRSGGAKGSKLPLIYFALLIPSIVFTIADLGLIGARRSISFHLSGPFAFAVCGFFFSRLTLSVPQIYRLYLMILGPVVGVASLALSGILSAELLHFSTHSNRAMAGGFGPNQVSAAIGLGVMLAFFFVMDGRSGLLIRGMMFLLMIGLAVQSAMTFSRGGLYTAVGGMVVSSFYLLRDRQSRMKMIWVLATLFLVLQFLLLPYLDSFTGGALLRRFQDMSLTGRDQLIVADLRIWAEHPLFGVGPGQSEPLHKIYFQGLTAHTEYSRMVAEHGALGFIALLLMIVMQIRNLFRARTRMGKALVASISGWSFVFLMSAAMRLVAPAFLLGLTFVTLLPEESRRSRSSVVAGNRANA